MVVVLEGDGNLAPVPDASGRIVDSTPAVRSARLLSAADLRRPLGGTVTVDRAALPEDDEPARLLHAVRERFVRRAEEHGGQIDVAVPDGLVAVADRVRLEQALGNLVDNALCEKIDRPFGVESIETVRGAGYRLRTDGGGRSRGRSWPSLAVIGRPDAPPLLRAACSRSSTKGSGDTGSSGSRTSVTRGVVTIRPPAAAARARRAGA
jgi:hypothetical protein